MKNRIISLMFVFFLITSFLLCQIKKDDLVSIKENGTLDLTTNVVRITNLTKEKYGLNPISSFQNLKNIVTLYPYDYFCPKDWETGEIHCTENTYTIHHFSGSWHGDKEKKQAEKYRRYNRQHK